jgi:hypothetical protein
MGFNSFIFGYNLYENSYRLMISSLITSVFLKKKVSEMDNYLDMD